MLAVNPFQQLLLVLPFMQTNNIAVAHETPLPVCADNHHVDWDYDNELAWSKDFPYCLGFYQSPIEIYDNAVNTMTIAMRPFEFYNYFAPLDGPLILINNGHSVQMDIPMTEDGDFVYISGGLLTKTYIPKSLHFHWGSAGIDGSEHTINGRKYPMEMHIILRDAQNIDENVIVVVIMIDTVEIPNSVYPGLDTILSHIQYLKNYGSQATINEHISFEELLGDLDLLQYYSYRGSFTTPPCCEVVTFLVFPNPLIIAQSKLSAFWELLDKNDKPLINNFRGTQPINGRTVVHVSQTI